MKPGISTYAFTWAIGVPGYPVANPMTALQLLDKAVELNVSCIQYADNLPLHKLSDTELINLKKKADEADISIEVGTRGLTPDNILTYIKIAEQMESPILRIVIDTNDFQPSIPEIINILNQIEPAFETKNIKLAIENHDRFKAKEFLHILQTIDSEYIGICLDSVNSMGAGEGVEVITELLGQFTINLHVKEFIVRRIDHKMGFQIEGKPAGQGMLPLEWMLEKLNPDCTSAILEQWVPPEKTIEQTIQKEAQWAKQSIKHLKTIFK